MKNSTKKSARANIYLYAITAADDHLENIHTFEGILQQPVYTITYHDIVIIVSDILQSKIRPERRHLAAHYDIQKKSMENHTILPIRFGIIVKDIVSLHKLLEQNHKSLSEQLARLANKIEMSLLLSWNVPNIFEYFIDIYPELRKSREQLFAQHHKSPRNCLIQLGEQFSELLDNEREQHGNKLKKLISSLCDEIHFLPPHNETEIINLACLIPHEHQPKFEQKIIEIAQLWDDNFLIKYTGPWPAYNFVQAELEI